MHIPLLKTIKNKLKHSRLFSYLSYANCFSFSVVIFYIILYICWYLNIILEYTLILNFIEKSRLVGREVIEGKKLDQLLYTFFS